MIKGQLVKFDDIRIAPLMFCMTAFAFLMSYLGLLAVITAALIYVLFNLFMAIETKHRLAMTIETIMTLGTFMFDFHMPLDQFSRHDQRFDRCGVNGHSPTHK